MEPAPADGPLFAAAASLSQTHLSLLTESSGTSLSLHDNNEVTFARSSDIRKVPSSNNSNSKNTMTSKLTARQLGLAEKACAFLSASTDPYHAVSNSVIALEAAGFTPLSYNSPKSWKDQISQGGKYYYTVHHSTLVAFTVGPQYQPGGASGFHLIGGHTDSPNLRIKPRSKKPVKHGCLQVGVECYGGGLWHTWFDRDLSVSGKVLVRKQRQDGSTSIQPRLVQLKDPIARISTLCIHLQSAEERQAFKVNKEDHTVPIVATPSLLAPSPELEEAATKQIQGEGAEFEDSWRNGHEPALLKRLASEMGIETKEIEDFDLSFYDTQPASLGGLNKEFLYSGRLDNLATVFCAIEALVDHSSTMENDEDIKMVVCFDHEEVGSTSSHGAGSPVMAEALTRVSTALNGGVPHLPDEHAACLSQSFCLSIDQAHAIHPNYASKHEAQHAPLLNGGVVVKTNTNQRYTTNSLTGFCLREVARKSKIPLQEFCVRNDCPCGSTIGPAIAAKTGVRTVDAGMPQLSMHSCREVMGVVDLTHGLHMFAGFFRDFRSINDSLEENYPSES